MVAPVVANRSTITSISEGNRSWHELRSGAEVTGVGESEKVSTSKVLSRLSDMRWLL